MPRRDDYSDDERDSRDRRGKRRDDSDEDDRDRRDRGRDRKDSRDRDRDRDRDDKKKGKDKDSKDGKGDKAKDKAKGILDDIMNDSASSSDEEGGKKGKFSKKAGEGGGRSGPQKPGPSGNLWYFQNDKSLGKACLNSQLQFPQDYQPYGQEESNKVSEAYNQGRDVCDLGNWIVYFNQTVDANSMPRRLIPAPGEHVQVRQGTDQPLEKFRAVTLPSNWNPQMRVVPQQPQQQPPQIPQYQLNPVPAPVQVPPLQPGTVFPGFPPAITTVAAQPFQPALPSMVTPPVGPAARFGYSQPPTPLYNTMQSLGGPSYHHTATTAGTTVPAFQPQPNPYQSSYSL